MMTAEERIEKLLDRAEAIIGCMERNFGEPRPSYPTNLDINWRTIYMASVAVRAAIVQSVHGIGAPVELQRVPAGSMVGFPMPLDCRDLMLGPGDAIQARTVTGEAMIHLGMREILNY